jgi:hypothetical protein
MTDTPGQQQTITPERQMAAMQVGAVFNAAHEYLRGLEPLRPDGLNGALVPFMTPQLSLAHQRIDEAAMWAVKSVLNFGVPPAPPKAEAPIAPPAAPTPAPETVAPPSDETQRPGGDDPAQSPGGSVALPIDLQTI